MSPYELDRSGDAQDLIGYLRRSDNATIRARVAEMLGGLADQSVPGRFGSRV